MGGLYRSMSFQRRRAAIALALAIGAALPYALAGGGSFINLDDNHYVYGNPHVRAGLSVEAIRWAFTTFDAANWHPLTWLSHLLDVTLFGQDARWHHAVSVLIHAANTAMLFLALSSLTGVAGPSALAAALFGVHPLHVESVAWVAERKDLLSALFFMAVLWTYTAYVRRGGRGRYLHVVLSLALGLMSKPMLVTVPFLLLLLDWWPLGRWRPATAGGLTARPLAWGLLSEKIPLLLLCLGSGFVTILAQQSAGAVQSIRALPPGARLANAGLAYVAYLRQTLWPSGLAVYYPHPGGELSAMKVAGVLVLLCAVSALAYLQRLRRPHGALGWCWFLGMLVPVIGLIQVGNQARADRYTYLPLIGIFLAAAWLARELWHERPGSPWPPLAGAVVVLVFTGVSAVQAGYWRDSRTLFARSLAVTRDNPLAHNNLGEALLEARLLPEAAAEFEKALAILPDLPQAHYNLGLTLDLQSRSAEALEHYRKALRIQPGFVEAHIGVGIVLAKQRRHVEAEWHLREAVRLRPDSFEALANLGNALAARRRFAEARRAYGEALRLRPGSTEVRQLLAQLPPGSPGP